MLIQAARNGILEMAIKKKPILKKNEHRHLIQRPWKPTYPEFRQKSTKIEKLNQNRSARNCRIDRLDHEYGFRRKMNTAIRSSTPENFVFHEPSKVDKDSENLSKPIKNR